MFCKKNFYLYTKTKENRRELLGSIRLIAKESQWNMEINWKKEPQMNEDCWKFYLEADGQDLMLGEENGECEETGEYTTYRDNMDSAGKWTAMQETCHRSGECLGEWIFYHVRYEELSVLPDSVKATMNNSFLIHGLMNYKYIAILFSENNPEKTALGVPGIFHQREKEVAEMFGFTDFVGEKGSKTGSFGYYLRFL